MNVTAEAATGIEETVSERGFISEKLTIILLTLRLQDKIKETNRNVPHPGVIHISPFGTSEKGIMCAEAALAVVARTSRGNITQQLCDGPRLRDLRLITKTLRKGQAACQSSQVVTFCYYSENVVTKLFRP